MANCICSLILQRLYDKGLVSKGNIEMCKDEIEKELDVFCAMSDEDIKNIQSITDIPRSEMN